MTEGSLLERFAFSRCRACNAPMVWGVTESGAKMPVDPEPVEGGNVIVLSDAGLAGPLVKVLGEPTLLDGLAEPTVRYVSHFATCPNAEEFRRR